MLTTLHCPGYHKGSATRWPIARYAPSTNSGRFVSPMRPWPCSKATTVAEDAACDSLLTSKQETLRTTPEGNPNDSGTVFRLKPTLKNGWINQPTPFVQWPRWVRASSGTDFRFCRKPVRHDRRRGSEYEGTIFKLKPSGAALIQE